MNLEVVGYAADWSTLFVNAPATNLDMRVVDWELFPNDLGVQALTKLRLVRSSAIVVILISHLDTRQQAAHSAGADAFISKGEMPDCVVERLRAVAATIRNF